VTIATILIVEDEWLIAEDTACILKAAGYEIAGPVASVRTALILLATEHVDAALLDVKLNGELSFPIAERLGDLHIPYAFVSGNASDAIPAQFMRFAALQKPFLAHSICSKAAELMAASRAEQAQIM
jgi:DNA-binding response OmpR family regulator